MRAPRFWNGDLDPHSREAAPLTRLILTPLSALYAGVTRWKIAHASPLKLDIPVICVGNLTAGGTGKTPITATLRDYFGQRYPRCRIATLSRGYGGSSKGPMQVAFDRHTAAEVGDEALMFAGSGEAWIGRDRAQAGKTMQEDGVNLIIMDDGHQNPTLFKDISIVVVDSEAGFGNGHVIPKGPLREPVSEGLRRAQAIVLTGNGDSPTLPAPPVPILRSRIVPAISVPAQAYVAFAGIGRPEKFFDTLEEYGSKPVDAVPFPDHHVFSDDDLRYLRALSAKRNARLITTEKDFARLKPHQREDILTLPVRAEFEDTEALDKLVASVARRLQ